MIRQSRSPRYPYALIGPDGRMQECGMFKSEKQVWQVLVGSLNKEETAIYKSQGLRVARVRVVEDGVASEVRAKILAREGGV